MKICKKRIKNQQVCYQQCTHFSKIKVFNNTCLQNSNYYQNHFSSWPKMLKVLILLLVLALSEAGRKSPKLTLSKTGCKCWWDLEGKLIDPKTDKPYSCACCKPNGKQCGYPQHNWCTHKKSKTGCKAVNHFRYTLSEVIQ